MNEPPTAGAQVTEAEALRLARDLVAAAAHKLSGPLTTICAFSQNTLLKADMADKGDHGDKGAPLDPDVRHAFEEIRAAGERMTTLIQCLRRLEAALESRNPADFAAARQAFGPPRPLPPP